MSAPTLRPPGARRRWIVVSRPLLALLALLAAPLAAEADVEPLSLAAALRLAAERHPLLVEQAAAVAAAEGELLAARTLPHNPVLEVERASRDEAGERSKDREIALAQELELGGQRRQRIASATARLEAAHAERERAGQELAAEVATAFVDALAARELAALAHLEQELAGALFVFAERRLEAGAGTLVERNVARAAAGRAEWAHALAAAEEAAARIALAALIGVPAAELPPLAGALPAAWPPPPPAAELEAAALAGRPDFVAQRAELEAAAARLRLERAAAVPNLVVGVARGREADREDLDTVRAGIAIPLFQRNQGAIAVARAEAEAERARLFGTELTVRREVAAAAARAEATARALGLLQHAVAGSLGENLDLVRKGLAAGKLRASEVLVMRQELVASHRDLIAAAADAWRAQIALALALGAATPPLPDPTTPTLEAVR